MKRFKKFLDEEDLALYEMDADDLVGDDDSDEEATEYRSLTSVTEADANISLIE